MRIVYLLTHAGLFRNFDSTLRLLVEHGHDVHVAFESERYPSAAFEAFAAGSPNLSVGRTPPMPNDRWAALGRAVRASSDYVRYLDPRYAEAPKLRDRARRQVPPLLRGAIRPGRHLSFTDRSLRAVERALPIRHAMLEFLDEHRPDLIALSPLFGSVTQLEAIRAARSLGVPTCLTVASWDNLTNKGLIRDLPDTVVVWNEMQRIEALELHGVRPDRVAVTGAQNFDEWFERTPSTGYEEFTRRLGLRSDRPYLLYLGSSSFIAPREGDFAVDWLRRLRANPDDRLREIGVLFRPHPQNARDWARPEIAGDSQAAVYPPPDIAPQQTGRADWSREDFFDSMHHAAAAIGVNTTAMIESAVLGRGVYTMLAPAFRDTQRGTLHFEHLRSAGGGLVHLSEDFDSHFAQLAEAVGHRNEPSERSRRFVCAFVRPHGLDRAATPILVNALEEAAEVSPQPVGPEGGARRAVLQPLAAMALLAEWSIARRRAILKRRRKKRGPIRRAADTLRRVWEAG